MKISQKQSVSVYFLCNPMKRKVLLSTFVIQKSASATRSLDDWKIFRIHDSPQNDSISTNGWYRDSSKWINKINSHFQIKLNWCEVMVNCIAFSMLDKCDILSTCNRATTAASYMRSSFPNNNNNNNTTRHDKMYTSTIYLISVSISPFTECCYTIRPFSVCVCVLWKMLIQFIS